MKRLMCGLVLGGLVSMGCWGAAGAATSSSSSTNPLGPTEAAVSADVSTIENGVAPDANLVISDAGAVVNVVAFEICELENGAIIGGDNCV